MPIKHFLFYIKMMTVIGLILVARPVTADIVLDYNQSRNFRSWFIRIIHEQFRQGPTPRWTHRDCAGLVRFATYEAFKTHDHFWLRANGLSNRYLPPEVNLKLDQQGVLNTWKLAGGEETGAYVSAIVLIQENAHFISRNFNDALPGDLIFFDQGEHQHLMVWMRTYIAYHTGTVTENDNGLRKVTLHQMMNWRDTRWQPRIGNPNFIGLFRFSFLSR